MPKRNPLMLEPWTNPRSKYLWFRRRVPNAYRKFGLPAEIKFSLETEDPDEARLRCAEHNLRLEREWRSHLVGTSPTPLSHLQISALAGEFYRSMVAAHLDEPGSVGEWEDALAKHAQRRRPFVGPLGLHLRTAFGGEAQAFLRSKGVDLIGDRFEMFVRAYVDAKEHASRTLMRAAQRDYTVDQKAMDYPKLELSDPRRDFEVLWEEFARAKGLAAATRKKWKPYFFDLIARVGSSDMGKVAESHLLDWRDSLLASKLSPVTVKDGHIAAAKAFFGWAKRGKKIPSDPTAEVVVEINERKHAAKMRGFTDEEAATILSAALAPMSELMSRENAAARRWVPWLCAYTGARVNEMTQLRACDVKIVKGLPCVHITPEAGSVKTSKARTVPLHPHLIEQGFLDFARRNSGETPLFYSIERQRKPDRKNPTYKSVGNKLAGWVRGLGIDDPLVAPNHGWRHRFKTDARRIRMSPEVRDAIQGHAPRTEGEDYGDVPADVMHQEIVRLPRFHVEAGEKRDGRRMRS